MNKWPETDIVIKDIIPYERNPRRMTKDQFDNLVKSIRDYGYHQRILVNQDMKMMDGHHRKKALLKLGFKPTDKIKVLVSDRMLSHDEFKRINIITNLPFGEFDFDMLTADFDIGELIDMGMPESWLPHIEDIKEEKEEKEAITSKKTECPSCGYEF
jgi:ParB-like chromosome segregation protein Spo0J